MSEREEILTIARDAEIDIVEAEGHRRRRTGASRYVGKRRSSRDKTVF